MNNNLVQDTFYKVLSSLREDVYKHLENELYESEIYELGVSDVTEDMMIKYIENILVSERTRQKFVNSISKTILQKDKQLKIESKLRRARKLKLWKATKGKIPCLRECGFYQTKSKEEVLHDGNNFICPECSKELEGDISGTMKLFDSKNVYSIYNIK